MSGMATTSELKIALLAGSARDVVHLQEVLICWFS